MNLFTRSIRWVERWDLTSQHQARRNAMIASTALAQRRAERVAVEEFLAARAARPSLDHAPVESPAPMAHG